MKTLGADLKLIGGPRNGAVISDPGGRRICMPIQPAESSIIIVEYAPSPNREYAIFLHETVRSIDD
jgi:hypothetical protein